MKRFYRYIEDVKSGKVKTGKLIRLAIDRHEADLSRGDFVFDEEKAQKGIKFFEILRHWKGEWAGQRLELEPHQCFFLGLLFGWRKKDGTKRFGTFFYTVARKNAKTTIAAGLALYHLFMDNEAGAQAYIAATKEDQARIGFRDVQEIIKKTPELRWRFHNYVKSSVYGDSFIKPLGSDSNTQDGFDPSMGIIDEYHAHPTDGMLNVLESGMGARREPMIVIITTAGFKKEFPCYANLRKSCIEVLQGIKEDDSLLPIIYEMDEGDDWTLEENWVKANPNIDVSVKREFLRGRLVKAKNEGASKEVDFKTKNLNVWTDSAKTWIPDEKYMACVGEYPELDGACFGGLDLSSTRDITAFVLRWRVDDKDYRRFWFFLPEERAKYNSHRDDFKYQNWINEGHIIATPGDTVDYDYIKHTIMEQCEAFDVRRIYYDRWNSSQLVINLIEEGLPMEPLGQGFVSMSTPTKEYERRVYSGLDIHDSNPVMRWMLGNVTLRTDPAGNIKVDKEKSSDKVDGVVADIMSLAAAMDCGMGGRSVYEDRGVLSLDDI